VRIDAATMKASKDSTTVMQAPGRSQSVSLFLDVSASLMWCSLVYSAPIQT
jgi:hypothetical protein